MTFKTDVGDVRKRAIQAIKEMIDSAPNNIIKLYSDNEHPPSVIRLDSDSYTTQFEVNCLYKSTVENDYVAEGGYYLTDAKSPDVVITAKESDLYDMGLNNSGMWDIIAEDICSLADHMISLTKR